MAGWLVDWLVKDWLVDLLVGWLVGDWLVGWGLWRVEDFSCMFKNFYFEILKKNSLCFYLFRIIVSFCNTFFYME